jgi:D-3-phosphoglycerate dehydrogenase
MMKKSAMLINCARGGLVDEAALYEALRNRQIAGAALDVYENEPPVGSPLLDLDNIVFTPHLGASTNEAQEAVSVEIARQAALYLQTGEAVNALNLPRLSAEDLKKSFEFINLATLLGKVLFGLATQPLQKLEVATFGRAAEVAVRPISVGALVGVLQGQVSTTVNRVNAENLAKRQGIALVESMSQESRDYVSLIKITGYCADQTLSLSGALLGGRQPRLVCMNQFEIEVVPEGTLLVTRHNDRPGVISSISAVLGNANINITRMQVSNANDEQQAMAVIAVSAPVSAELMQQLAALPPVYQVKQINL